ncbi:amino acid adenylation domain-containing protein [Candidatus Sumerlaeota bacterium]|nr:amino acid adenylation domain-containing protein [Candidatus Sumerlaeota bacterium]
MTQTSDNAFGSAQAQGSSAPSGAPAGAESFPLTLGQEAIWLLHQLAPSTGAYNIGFALRAAGPLDPTALERAVERLAERHPILRARFRLENGDPGYRIADESSVPFALVDAHGCGDDALSRRLHESHVEPFDLEGGPVFRVRLFRIGPEDHVLLFSIHHIVADDESLAVLLGDLLASLDGAALPPTESSHADGARRERAFLESDAAEKQLAFWRDALSGELANLDLPTDRPRPPVRSHQGSSVRFVMDPSLRRGLEDLAASESVSLDVVLLTAFQVVLMRHSAQEEIRVGVSLPLRDRPRDAVGYLVNPVAVRGSISDNPSLRTALKETSERLAKAGENREYPFPRIVQKIRHGIEPNRSPIFQAEFSFGKHPLLEASREIHGLKIAPFALNQEEGQLDVALSVEDWGSTLHVALSYDSALFDRATIERLGQRFRMFLQSAVADPDQGVLNVSMLPDAERRLLLETWNSTQSEYPRDACVHHLFEAQARRTPDRVAVVSEGARLTYAELDKRANRLGRLLRTIGVGPDVLVGIYMNRSVEMMAAILGVWKANGAYVPLDPSFPIDRLAYMIQDSGLQVLLTDESLRDAVPETTARVVCVDRTDGPEHGAGTSSSDRHGRKVHATPDNLAYVIYTSGSTGKPKGVQVLHRGVVNFLASMRREPGLDENDVLLAVTTLSFDISVLELLLPLTAGARMVIASREIASSGSLLAEAIAQSGATVMQGTPASWRLLLAAGWTGRKNFKVLCGGEALAPDLARELLARAPQVWNMYGPTETTVWSTCARLSSPDAPIAIGRPIGNTKIYILDRTRQPVPQGAVGELYIGGDGVARGYLNQPERTREKFVPDPFAPERDGARIYATGDLARYLPDGSILCLGRLDHQVKIRGYRIELGEIEAALSEHAEVRQSVVVAREDEPGDKRLVAYLVPRDGPSVSPQDLRRHLLARLPEYMVPALFISLQALPETPNGKTDRRALPAPDARRPDLREAWVAPQSRMERDLADLWKGLLKLDRVGIRDNFFDLGGNSLLAYRVVAELSRRLDTQVPVVRTFQYPTIHALARFLTEGQETEPFLQRIAERARRERRAIPEASQETRGVAVIGMAGRFPAAENLEQLWRNLCNGVESVTVFSREELGPGIDESLRNDPDYVPARGILTDADKFDAAFFGIRPREAEVMDPQQRVFLEDCWAALEHAGYDPDRCDGLVGVYAGMGNNTYFRVNVSTRPDLIRVVGDFQAEVGTEKDHIAPRVSYLLNLTGPSLSVHTACSTSLVTVDNAFHDLMAYRCDMALAGGVDVTVPQKSGQLYQDGGVFTRDGHCRPFDADATGTMFGEGSGVVVLKRLDEALRDGDTVYAVIAGSAINHDGSNKVSYLAPSVDGQAEVVALAQARAGFDPASITYIEAHGTGTPIGDPIEIEGLTKAFRLKTEKKQFCAIGSIKGNLSHSTTAAGIAGLLKAVLCLYHKTLVPSINYSKPNPRIDFANSPFYVNTELKPWPATATPRRAGVSSFGFCGTNAHAVLEEAPALKPSSPSRPRQLFLLSAKTEGALDRATANLRAHLESHPETNFANAAYTLQTGRKAFEYRRFVVARDVADAASILESLDANFASSRRCETASGARVAFMFPGQGSQYVNMGANLYRDEPVFRETVDRCAEILKPHLGRDLREMLYPAPGDAETAAASLKETFYTQPAIFTIEYALARLWESWGIRPAATIGHSIGEFVCACLAEVFALEDALFLVATRGRLMQELPGGAMLSVRLPAAEVEKRLPPDCSIAAVNGPSLCVVSGPNESVAKIQKELEGEGTVCRHLHTSHAFHSPTMDSIVEPFAEHVRTVALHAPKIPFVSTVTTRWISAVETTDPMYWARHLRSTVRFAEGVRELWEDPSWILLEVGPRTTATTLARQQAKDVKKQVAIPSLSDTPDDEAEWTALLKAVGSLWLNGVSIDWRAFYSREERRRVALPTYSFERTRYWIDPVLDAARPSVGKRMPVPEAYAIEAEKAPETEPAERTGKGGRKERLAVKVREILQFASGLDLSGVDETTTFLEMGLDSLFLTQAARQLQTEFGVKITFRLMLEKHPTLRTLAEYLDAELPPETPTEAEPQATATPARPGGGEPPVPGARLGRDPQGNPAWFVPDPDRPGKYLRVGGAK